LHQPQKPNGAWSNLFDTQIALVEAEEGIAIIPSFGMPACRNRKITTSQLINPVVRFEFHMISRRGRQLPPGAEEFTSFLKSYELPPGRGAQACSERVGDTGDAFDPYSRSRIGRICIENEGRPN
jgi:DNA-binding transcriptional LysR family regulator